MAALDEAMNDLAYQRYMEKKAVYEQYNELLKRSERNDSRVKAADYRNLCYSRG